VPPTWLTGDHASMHELPVEQSPRAAYTRIERSSVTDALLGIFNRRYLHEQLPQEVARARRYGRAVSVVMADLDHFKRIADTYGHQSGDVLLRHAVALARSTLRQSDWIARYGEEEFVMVLPETTRLGAYAAAERMRRLCAETPVRLGGTQLVVTVSFGVATIDDVPGSIEDAEAVLREADAALCESKRAGRNRVTCGPKPTTRSAGTTASP
jgi:diguanylate cyclase (GGDEF)-like protein